MINLFRAFFFKLTKDLTFRITAIIGVGLAIVISLIFFAIDKVSGDDGLFRMASGQNLLITSLSPTQNFGLSVPINLITFTVLEFTQGTIRNKIIAGNSKGKIYASLFISGLISPYY